MSTASEQTADAGELDDTTVEIERIPAQAADARPPAAHCTNCGTPLAGPYCSQCGQRHHEHPVHHFWHFLGEATEDLTHADSRLWRTLTALLFRPGFLTREFLEGRRARYLPPVRLYLVVSLICFLIVGLHSRLSSPPAPVFSSNGKSFQYSYGQVHDVTGSAAVARTPAQTQRNCGKLGALIGHGGWLARLGPRVTRGCLAAAANGGTERLSQSFDHNIERAMFLLLPLLALVMKPLYLKPARHYVEHLLFFLHAQAFLFVLLGLTALLETLTSSGWVLGPVQAVFMVYVPIYFYLAMRRVYGQGRWLTLGKLATLGGAYFFLVMLLFAATFSYSFLTL